MKTSDIAILAALGIGGYYLITKGQNGQSVLSGGGGSSPINLDLSGLLGGLGGLGGGVSMPDFSGLLLAIQEGLSGINQERQRITDALGVLGAAKAGMQDTQDKFMEWWDSIVAGGNGGEGGGVIQPVIDLLTGGNGKKIDGKTPTQPGWGSDPWSDWVNYVTRWQDQNQFLTTRTLAIQNIPVGKGFLFPWQTPRGEGFASGLNISFVGGQFVVSERTWRDVYNQSAEGKLSPILADIAENSEVSQTENSAFPALAPEKVIAAKNAFPSPLTESPTNKVTTIARDRNGEPTTDIHKVDIKKSILEPPTPKFKVGEGVPGF